MRARVRVYGRVRTDGQADQTLKRRRYAPVLDFFCVSRQCAGWKLSHVDKLHGGSASVCVCVCVRVFMYVFMFVRACVIVRCVRACVRLRVYVNNVCVSE